MKNTDHTDASRGKARIWYMCKKTSYKHIMQNQASQPIIKKYTRNAQKFQKCLGTSRKTKTQRNNKTWNDIETNKTQKGERIKETNAWKQHWTKRQKTFLSSKSSWKLTLCLHCDSFTTQALWPQVKQHRISTSPRIFIWVSMFQPQWERHLGKQGKPWSFQLGILSTILAIPGAKTFFGLDNL